MMKSVYALIGDPLYYAFMAKCQRINVNPRERFAKLIADDVNQADFDNAAKHAKGDNAEYLREKH